ncbi:MAG: hypothetical protein HQL27_01030 [Candidatus Omnitrophica bacterium]|nr:hypothetical protein [Candidatus Omnitrophota bacterium]
MKRFIKMMLFFAVAFTLAGCYSTGLSLREKGSFNYSNFIYGLYNRNDSKAEAIKKVKTPIKLAVAQVGENTPPDIMVKMLEKEGYLVSEVMALPAGGNDIDYYNNERKSGSQEIENRMDKMRRLAKDLGTDYIFLFGGSSDIGTSSNWLGFFDITIVGAFVIPSQKITAEGRAAGALVEVESGKVVLTVNSEDSKTAYASSANLSGQHDAVLISMRNDLVDRLSKELIKKLSFYSGDI